MENTAWKFQCTPVIECRQLSVQSVSSQSVNCCGVGTFLWCGCYELLRLQTVMVSFSPHCHVPRSPFLPGSGHSSWKGPFVDAWQGLTDWSHGCFSSHHCHGRWERKIFILFPWRIDKSLFQALSSLPYHKNFHPLTQLFGRGGN